MMKSVQLYDVVVRNKDGVIVWVMDKAVTEFRAATTLEKMRKRITPPSSIDILRTTEAKP